MADLFIAAKIWKQPRSPSVGEHLDTLRCIQTSIHYSVPKRNELSSREKTWRKVKSILLSERNQSGKATYCVIPTIRHSRKGKTMEIAK